MPRLILKTQQGKSGEPIWVIITTPSGEEVRLTARRTPKNSTLTELVIEAPPAIRIHRENAKIKQ